MAAAKALISAIAHSEMSRPVILLVDSNQRAEALLDLLDERRIVQRIEHFVNTNGFAPLQAPPLDSAISMPVTRLVLFESVRGRAGVRYVEREVILLDTPS